MGETHRGEGTLKGKRLRGVRVLRGGGGIRKGDRLAGGGDLEGGTQESKRETWRVDTPRGGGRRLRGKTQRKDSEGETRRGEEN